MKLKSQILLIFFLFITAGISAQEDKGDGMAFKDRLWYGFNIGGIGISNNTFTAGIAPMGGVKVTDDLAFGVIAKLNYTYQWRQGYESQHFFEYGPGVFAKYRLFKQKYFLQVEYDWMKLPDYFFFTDYDDVYDFLYVGGGISYPSGGKWKSDLTILYNVHPETRDLIFPLNLTYAFIYNF